MISDQARQLGHALVAAKLLTPKQLQDLIAEAEKDKSQSLIVGLLNYGHLTFKMFEKFVGQNLGIKSAMIAQHSPDPQLIKLITFDTIQRRMVYPLASRMVKEGRTIALGMVDPLDAVLIKDLEKKLIVRIVPVLISLPDFKEALTKLVLSKTNKPAAKAEPAPEADESLPDFSQDHAPFANKAPAVPNFKPMPSAAPKNPEAQEPAFGEIERFTRGSEIIPSLVNQVNQSSESNPFGTSTEAVSLNTASVVTNTMTVQPKPQMTRTIAVEDKSFVTSQSRVIAPYLGSNNRKFKEEVIVGLELQPEEARKLTDEHYTRDNLPAHLKNLNPATLQKIYADLNPEEKLEALANALMRAGFLDKNDLLISGALSRVFKEEKK